MPCKSSHPTVTSSFESDFFVCSFIASVAVFQLAVAKAKITNLTFSTHIRTSVVLSFAALILAFALFFGAKERNINDFAGGLDANQQAFIFLASTTAAFLFTGGICSFKFRKQPQIRFSHKEVSFESLKTITLANLYIIKWIPIHKKM